MYAHSYASICCRAQRGGMSGRPTPTAGGDQVRGRHGGGSRSVVTPGTQTGPNHFALIWCGEPRRPLQSLLTKVIVSEDSVCELTVSASGGGDTGRGRGGRKKSLEKLQDYKASAIVRFLGCTASVCVSHLSLVCGGGRVRWEILDTPPATRHLSRKSSVPPPPVILLLF